MLSRRVPQRPDLGDEVGLILGDVVGEVDDLERDDRGQSGYQHSRQGHDQDGRGDAADAPSSQLRDRRAQHEAEQHGEGDRDEDLAQEVERRHRRGQHADGHQRARALMRRRAGVEARG